MVVGYENFKHWFAGYEDQFVIIGGTACDILMSEDDRTFRATKDIDIVLLIETLTADFGKRFWDYVQEGAFQHRNKSNGAPQFYRFTNPGKPGFPLMIELFSRRTDVIALPADAVLTPLPLDDEISSLSAILMDDVYYQFLLAGRIVIDGTPILDAEHLIPFKARAWLDLSARKAIGESVDSKNIRKHKNDIFRLLTVTQSKVLTLPESMKQDLDHFIAAMREERPSLRDIGIAHVTLDDMLENLATMYV
ncbi:MAG: hypothetical protein LBS96_05415 [Oscillospiraceae bacterium]|jgi:hypothetical protein|nr:hypothetical protein [Oscillospiraceae bacterium]